MFQGGYSTTISSYHEEYLPVMEILNNCTMSEAKPDQPVLTLDLRAGRGIRLQRALR